MSQSRKDVECFSSAEEHLLTELERLDLILLERLHAVGKARIEPKRFLNTDDVLTQLSSAGEQLSDDDHRAEIRRRKDQLSVVIAARIELSLARGIRLPIIELARNLNLDAVSLAAVVIAVAPHVDRKYERVYAFLQDDLTRPEPRVDLALTLLAGSATERLALRDRFADDSPLLRSGLVRLGIPPEGPQRSWLSRTIDISPRLVRFLLDQDGAERAVEAMRPGGPLPPATISQQHALDQFDRIWQLDAGAIGIIQTGDSAAGLCSAAELARKRGRPFLPADLARAAAVQFPISERIQSAINEARLTGALLAFIGIDELGQQGKAAAATALAAGLDRYQGPCVIFCQAGPDLHRELSARAVLILHAPPPDLSERRELWQRGLRDASADHADEVAWRFRLGSGQIHDAARMFHFLEAARSANGSSGPAIDSLIRACQFQSRHQLGDLAQLVPPQFNWDDLVLPGDSVTQLRSVVAHLRHREVVFDQWGFGAKAPYGRGLAVLFSGPPGTGKTMSASLVAGELKLELFRIDLAGIVSKYIGETEKNLDRVFAAAWRSNAILFFDEADALFGKRTEVKDAHDRHANVETSYLLQKIEEFDGVTILATNLKKNIDPAFLRRIQILVDFPFPTSEMRRRLWRTLLPDQMPVESSLEIAFLADQFELAGGAIKNVIQTAAVMAASDGAVVRLGHILHGIRRELQKQGRILNISDFGRYASLLEQVSPSAADGKH
ncbi:MAG: ATP-binding protein [Proteobacteria bacterium]|nr:ATP-binding protein [Pseudomonadota bacterium]